MTVVTTPKTSNTAAIKKNISMGAFTLILSIEFVVFDSILALKFSVQAVYAQRYQKVRRITTRAVRTKTSRAVYYFGRGDSTDTCV
jgi:hypothetical protein